MLKHIKSFRVVYMHNSFLRPVWRYSHQEILERAGPSVVAGALFFKSFDDMQPEVGKLLAWMIWTPVEGLKIGFVAHIVKNEFHFRFQ